ncbi:glycosyltransferase family 2 protein [bacterium]|nr:glycosyltransferase family 2 protein [bacterium]
MESPALSIAIVMPVFNEEAVLTETFSRLTALFEQHREYQWRAILVDDGSKDSSGALLDQQQGADPRFEVVTLTRNFGFQSALAAGIDAAAEVDAVITLDADLQDPPEVVPDLIRAWRDGADVVLAVRRTRQETGLRRMGMDAFHAVFGKLTDQQLTNNNAGTFGLMGREAADAFRGLPERNRFFPGLRAWVGYQVAEVSYDRDSRAAGQPKQSFGRLVSYALDGLFSFSRLPLRAVSYVGVFVALIGFGLGTFYTLRRLVGIEVAQTGFTTLVTLVLFLGGIQLIGIGVLGEYLGRIYDEVKTRPLYLVKKRDGKE